MQRVPMTTAGAEALRKELDQLKKVDRPRISAAIAEAREHLGSTKVSPGPRLRGQIRAMMARPGIEREHRDEFRELWGPVDDLDGNELVAASQWVIDKIAEHGVEPF